MATPKRIEVLLNEAAEDFIRKFQLRTFQVLASAMPVDTGFVRSGTTPSTGSPVALASRPPKDKSKTRGAAAARFATNQARAISIAGTYKLGQGKVFIVNPTVYLPRLNGGSSSQAGPNFIEKAVLASFQSFGIA